MITALQHFISRKGKFVFILLLLLVVVSFVLYLSQGSSVFDLFSDEGREKQPFFGYDWNDPEQRKFLSVTSRAAGSLGALVSPVQDQVDLASSAYMQGLQKQMQSVFRANPEEVDREAMQRMFEYMQSWANFPRDFKAREIGRSGGYDSGFLDASIEAKVVLSNQAKNWGFLPQDLNLPSINTEFLNFLTSVEPGLESEANRSSILSLVGRRYGMSPSDLESVLFSCFREQQVDRIYSSRGFSLSDEPIILSQGNAFAWDGEVAVLRANDLPKSVLSLGTITFSGVPKSGDTVEVKAGAVSCVFEFTPSPADFNGTKVGVLTGKSLDACTKNLIKSLNSQPFPFRAVSPPKTKHVIRLELNRKALPKDWPELKFSTKGLAFQDDLRDNLSQFHQKNKELEVFSEPPRTFATAVIFQTEDFLVPPVPADEARLRSYFERNQLDFIPAVEKEENSSLIEEVKFEDVIEDVRKKVEAQDQKDAQEEGGRLAQSAALKFLDQLNAASDSLSRGYQNYQSLRASPEMKELIANSGGTEKKVAFTKSDMNVQAMVLGLEKRSSEIQSNLEPLEEVDALDERKFFTRSVRKARKGHIVFLLDRKTVQAPMAFEKVSFSSLCREYASNLDRESYNSKTSELLSHLTSNKTAPFPGVKIFPFEAKNSRMAQSSYDAKQRSVRAQIQKLEKQKENRSKEEQSPDNLGKVDQEISDLRQTLENLTTESGRVTDFLEGALTQEVNGQWFEVEMNEEEAIFGKLSEVYSLLGKETVEEQKNNLQRNLEFSRGMVVRDQIIEELIAGQRKSFPTGK